MLNRIQIQDDMFTPDVIADPYAYYGRIPTVGALERDLRAMGRHPPR